MDLRILISGRGAPKWPELWRLQEKKEDTLVHGKRPALGWWVRELGADREPNILDRVLSLRLCIALEEEVLAFF